MSNVLEDSLFVSQNKKFDEIQSIVRQFSAEYGATNFEDVRCISLVSVFSRLKEESNWTLADAEPYIESLIAFYQDHHQTTFRVMEASEVRRLQQIPCRQVLQEIFEGKFIELKNGMLRYKQ